MRGKVNWMRKKTEKQELDCDLKWRMRVRHSSIKGRGKRPDAIARYLWTPGRPNNPRNHPPVDLGEFVKPWKRTGFLYRKERVPPKKTCFSQG